MTKSEPLYHKGERIGDRFLILAVTGGGFGEVYICFDEREQKPYALKTFRSPNSMDLRNFTGFQLEVENWIELGVHNNIVRCFRLEEFDSHPFLLLELIMGHPRYGASLDGWINAGGVDSVMALEITIDVCRGLIHANHKNPGLVHRDLKPNNILLTEDHMAKITDWGLARVFAKDLERGPSERKRVYDEDILGTPFYMAPELWLQQEQDFRTDIYSLGCVFYEMLTGYPLVSADTVGACRHQHVEVETKSLLKKRVLPDPFLGVLTKALAKDKSDRFDSLELMLQELLNCYENTFHKKLRTPPTNQDSSYLYFKNRAQTYSQLATFGTKQSYFREKAMQELDKAIDLEPNETILYTSRADMNVLLKRPDRAMDDINNAIAKDPKSPFPYHSLGNLNSMLGNFEQAVTNYSRAMELAPQMVPSLLNRGLMYLKLHLWDKAIQDFDRVISMQPRLAIAYVNRARVLADLGHLEQAYIDLDRAIALNPYEYEVYTERGKILRRQGKPKEALDNYTQALKLYPADPALFMVRGLLFQLLNNQSDALVDFTRAIKLDPSKAEFYYTRARLFMDLRDFKKANIDLTQAIELDGSSSSYWANRGLTYSYLDDPTKALEDVNEAVRIDPTNAEAFYYQGLIHHTSANFQQSIECFSHALTLDPELAMQIYINRALSYSNLSQFDAAIQDSQRALEIDALSAPAFAIRGYNLFHLGQLREAFVDAVQAVFIDPNLPLGYYVMGLSFDQIGRIEIAFPLLNKAVHLGHTPAIGITQEIRGDWENLSSEQKQVTENINTALESNLWEILTWLSSLIAPNFMAVKGFVRNGTESMPFDQLDGVRKSWDENDPEVKKMLTETQVALRLFFEAQSPEAMMKAVLKFPFMLDEEDFVALIEQDMLPQIPINFEEEVRKHLSWLREIAGENRSQEEMESKETPAKPLQLEELDTANELLALAKELLSKGNPSKDEHAIELADQAYSIFKRLGSEKADEALTIVNSIYAITRNKGKGDKE